ncbi:MAG: hypothetical protein C4533_05895 [Candidatus Omnitrophota bacterium]|jgi:hypothetical protein|nr:MAG: hypothetical protein C4533_05895 [Candidatus Omnitrophota bacterium]
MVTIGKYNFEGPYAYTGYLQDRAGVYAIVDDRSSKLIVIDVGESATVKSRVENHERENCWTRNRIGTLKVAVLYTPGLQQTSRMQIEQELREQFNPVCGVR